MEKNRCYGCMRPKTQGICEYCGFDENTQNAPHQLQTGLLLQGRYLIGRVLGQGGFGITYLGWDNMLDVPVAIKEYYPNGMVMRDCSISLDVMGNSTSGAMFENNRERFLREARTLAKFSDVPQIVHVHNLFLANNTAYIVMEYVQGMTLKDYVLSQGGSITAQETFAILRPVMEALSKVHQAGLVHRDISPDNIMLLPRGGAKLLDFGAVRDVSDADVDKALSRSTEAILKHGFAPIEQYQKRGSLGPWTDVYALCATIYYCLTGKVPADAPERVMGETEIDWDRVPDVTDHQAGVLEKGMELRPKDRYRSVEDLCTAMFEKVAPAEEPVPYQIPIEKKPQTETKYPVGTVPLSGGEDYNPTTPISRPGPQEAAAEPVSSKEPEVIPEKQDADQLTTPVYDAGPKETYTDTNTSAETRYSEISETKNKGFFGILAVAAVALVAIIALVAGVGGKKEEAKPTEPQPGITVTVPQAPESTAWVDNVLMRSDMKLNEEGYVDVDETLGDQSVFGSGITRKEILTVTFLDTLENAPDTSWDVSENQDGSVLAWTNANGAYYDLYIAGEGGVNGKNGCYNLFCGYLNVQSIQFNGNFHTNDATEMTWMFCYCQSLTEVDVSSLKTSNVANMNQIFAHCQNLKAVDVTSWDTSSAQMMNNTFSYCENLTSLDLSNFNTANVENMYNMFHGCSQLTELDVSNFDTSKVQSMHNMFYGCAFSDLDLSSFCTSSVTNMSGMFQETPNLKDIDLSSFDFSNVTDYSSFMDSGDTVNGRPWEQCFSGSQEGNWENNLMAWGEEWKDSDFVPCSEYDRNDISSITFLDSTAGAPGNAWDMSQAGDGSILAWTVANAESDGKRYDLYIAGNGGVRAPDDCETLFEFYMYAKTINCNGAFHTEYVTNMENMFAGCVRLESIDLTGFCTENVTNFSLMFNNCGALLSLDLRGFDTSKATTIASMFVSCESLQSVDVSSFNTSNVRMMHMLFEGCSSLTEIDISNFDMSNVNTVSSMFKGCTSLQYIDLGTFDVSNVSSYTNFMDEGVTIDGRPWEELFE